MLPLPEFEAPRESVSLTSRQGCGEETPQRVPRGQGWARPRQLAKVTLMPGSRLLCVFFPAKVNFAPHFFDNGNLGLFSLPEDTPVGEEPRPRGLRRGGPPSRTRTTGAGPPSRCGQGPAARLRRGLCPELPGLLLSSRLPWGPGPWVRGTTGTDRLVHDSLCWAQLSRAHCRDLEHLC